jgi:hypothetical protein
MALTLHRPFVRARDATNAGGFHVFILFSLQQRLTNSSAQRQCGSPQLALLTVTCCFVSLSNTVATPNRPRCGSLRASASEIWIVVLSLGSGCLPIASLFIC